MNHLSFLARRLAGKYWTKNVVNRCSRFLFENRYPADAQVRLLIYHHFSDICWSVVYPFFHYAEHFQRVYGLDTRLRPIERFFQDETADDVDADIVLVQPWLDEPADMLAAAFARYRARHPRARIVFVDSYANTDMRFGQAVAPHIDKYLRKAIFHDRREFLRPHAGDTNLTAFYGSLYGIDAEPVDWLTPEGLLDRVDLLPNFLTAPRLIEGFMGPAPEPGGRAIDLHCRIETEGTPWYAAMREQALKAARAISGIRLTSPDRVDRRLFLDELRQSKLCWSPFGYGELCWRDLEAIMAGSVLVKPNMSHLATAPDLYHPGETYLPVEWDFSDLEDVVRGALADPARLERISANAFAIAHDYLASERFVTDMGDILNLQPLVAHAPMRN